MNWQDCKYCSGMNRVAGKIAMFNGICWWKPCLKHRILAKFAREFVFIWQ